MLIIFVIIYCSFFLGGYYSLSDAFEIFATWTEQGPLHRKIDGRLPRFPKDVDRFFFGRLNTIIRLFEVGLQVLSGIYIYIYLRDKSQF